MPPPPKRVDPAESAPAIPGRAAGASRGRLAGPDDTATRLRLAIESTGAGTHARDLLTDEADWSPRLREMYDLADGEPASSAVWLSRIHPDDRSRALTAVSRALDPGGDGHYRVTFRVVRRDGTLRWIEGNGQVSFERVGGVMRPVRMAGLAFDVTEREERERALRDADRRKDEFLAMLAHELRNPLAPLVTALEVLARRASSSCAAERDALSIARRQTRQLGRLVDDLLEVARITRGMIGLRPAPLAPDAAIRDAVRSVAAQLDERRQSIALALPAQVAPIVADPSRIAQVLENLLNNASKFTPCGGSIEIALEDLGDELEIRVSDTGIGIDATKIGSIFELFAQADPTLDRAHGGLGIGLALVRRLVTMHGGRVWATSPGRGQGATFVVRLPRGGPGAQAG